MVRDQLTVRFTWSLIKLIKLDFSVIIFEFTKFSCNKIGDKMTVKPNNFDDAKNLLPNFLFIVKKG